MKRLILATAVAAALAGCATPPERIKAAANDGQPCTDADRQQLAELSKVQKATATNDAVGVFLIGVPMGSATGKDHEAEIATLKGRCEAPRKG
jgi:hypothetical protein